MSALKRGIGHGLADDICAAYGAGATEAEGSEQATRMLALQQELYGSIRGAGELNGRCEDLQG